MSIQPFLLETITVSITEKHRERLVVIDQEDYSGVIRKTKEYFGERGIDLAPEYIDRAIFALKQYYAVAMLDPANAHAVSSPIDPFWHFHILHTKQYMEFCERVVGEYMHHIPLDHSKYAQVENVRTLYEYTIDVLRRIFSFVDHELWPDKIPDAALICLHKGNRDIYKELQPIRLFEPDKRGENYAFPV